VKSKYDAFGLYHDAADPRLFVPKRKAWMGWTVNADHRFGRLVLAATGALVAGAVAAAIAQR